jgi:ribonuclease E
VKKKKVAAQSQSDNREPAPAKADSADGKPAKKRAARKRGPRKKKTSQANKPQQNPSEQNQADKADAANRKPRRRRSPYQTAGVKPRDGQTQDAPEKASSQPPRADSKPETKAESKPQAAEQSPQAPASAAKEAPERKPDNPPAAQVVKEKNGIYTIKPANSDQPQKETSHAAD